MRVLTLASVSIKFFWKLWVDRSLSWDFPEKLSFYAWKCAIFRNWNDFNQRYIHEFFYWRVDSKCVGMFRLYSIQRTSIDSFMEHYRSCFGQQRRVRGSILCTSGTQGPFSFHCFFLLQRLCRIVLCRFKVEVLSHFPWPERPLPWQFRLIM